MNGFSASTFAVDFIHPDRFNIEKYSAKLTDQLIAEYKEHYMKYEGDDAWTLLRQSPIGEIVDDQMNWPDRTAFEARPDVVWGREVVGFHHRAAIRINENPAYFNALVIQFGAERGNITDHEREVLRFYRPFLAKSMKTARLFSGLRHRYEAVFSVLNKIRIGVGIFEPSGELILSNRSADRHLEEGGPIRLSQQQTLIARSDEMTARINAAIKGVSDTASGQNRVPGSEILLSGSGGDKALLLEVTPLRDASGEIDISFVGAMVAMIEVSEDYVINVDSVGLIYGLTKSEKAVCEHLLRGHSVNEIADLRGVSVNTVRNQVQSAYAKIGVTTRIELAQKAAHVTPLIITE